MNGIINVYKEQGYTSFDVVAILRGILKTKKIGHTGTLDPDAVGVLPVCLGKGTRLCSLITDWGKTYEAVMLLGTTTDTLDISGNVIEKNSVDVSDIQVCEAVNSFLGEYEQIPPMYSALKVNGRKLYELARSGIEVERKPRRVNIKSIHINEMNLEDEEKTVTFTVECSKGTYIRSLCDDIGKKLGCGACMVKLIRKRVGCFGIDDTLTIAQIKELVDSGEIDSYIKSVDDMFPDYEKLYVPEEFNNLLYNGNKLTLSCVKSDVKTGSTRITPELLDMQQYRVYDQNNEFIGIYRCEADLLVPVKMFYDNKDNM
ncbi:MAG: tRNA pseudouridine(55) synthase TruB [Lachnospira sp.]